MNTQIPSCNDHAVRQTRSESRHTTTRPSHPLGCSAFCLLHDGDLWIGRNLDVPFSSGYVLGNHRRIAKQSVAADALSPARWTSLWGSLTVNLLGVDCPMGGINEQGLVVEHLWMPGTKYPARPACDALLEFEWIQYMLDTCSRVEDVRNHLPLVSILPDRVEMHFLLGDRDGNCALLEFRDGMPLFHSGPFFQPPVATNDWYDESVRHLSAFAGFGGTLTPSASSSESLDRFVRLAHAVDNRNPVMGQAVPETAMQWLDSVADSTLLSGVYHPSAGTLLFKTSQHAVPRLLRTADFDFSPGAPRVMLDIHAPANAPVPFDAGSVAAAMREALEIGGDFLRLDDYLPSMLDRQTKWAAQAMPPQKLNPDFPGSPIVPPPRPLC